MGYFIYKLNKMKGLGVFMLIKIKRLFGPLLHAFLKVKI